MPGRFTPAVEVVFEQKCRCIVLGVDVPRGCVAAQRVPPLQDSLDNRRITMVGLDVAVLGPPNEEGAAGMLGNPLTQVVRPPVVNPHV